MRAQCCKRWFDCPECHEEQVLRDGDAHKLVKTTEITLACKTCRKVFRVDTTYSQLPLYFSQVDEADEYCPHCDNHYVIDAITPNMNLAKKFIE